MILLPGFSTREDVDELSGRGVGLDVVQSAATRLKGRLTVDTTPGQGTTFRLRLPVVLAVSRAYLVRAGEQRYAIPVDNVARIASEPIDGAYAQLREGRLPVVDLGERLTGRAAGDHVLSEVLVIRAADEYLAVRVDGVDGPSEVVVKPLGRLLRKAPGLIGATVIGEHDVALVLDVAQLTTAGVSEQPRPVAAAPAAPAAPDAAAEEQARVALVVDDSLSVRRVLGRALERHGWETRQARDGVEALELLAAGRADVVVTDIEMPRMNGLELVAAIRNRAEIAALPIVVLTSRASDQHRQRAYEIGANAYLVKPFQEHELMAVLDAATAQA
jgi:chemosensory pili system protein ChpA (sensor histidine kinase/response regulator)